ncbi:MAG: glycosyltransferase family 9 protein [Ignavibacteriae bacterium]|nr:glycosyltransferase family 9 protein [Ignavibacteriota bacterium]
MQRKSIYRFFYRYIVISIIAILSLLFKREKRFPVENIKNILIIKFAAIGDIILMVPMLRLLKKNYPNAKITFLCSDINFSMVKRVKYIDEIIDYNIHSAISKPLEFLRFLKNIRINIYDLVIDAEQWSRVNAILTVFLKKKYLIGFKFDKQYKHFYYDAISIHTKKRHEVENFLSLLEIIGINAENEDKELEFNLSSKFIEFSEEFWNEKKLKGKYVICMQPGSGTNGYAREWSDENYINLGKRLTAKGKNIIILLTGLKSDFDRCENIIKSIGKNALNISGKYNMDKDLAIVKKSNMMICGNTGILHLSASVKTRTIGLHGPNNPVLWGAYDKNAVVVQSDIYCSPCLYLGHDFGCKKPVCMDRILIEDVYQKVIEVMKTDGYIFSSN